MNVYMDDCSCFRRDESKFIEELVSKIFLKVSPNICEVMSI